MFDENIIIVTDWMTTTVDYQPPRTVFIGYLFIATIQTFNAVYEKKVFIIINKELLH